MGRILLSFSIFSSLHHGIQIKREFLFPYLFYHLRNIACPSFVGLRLFFCGRGNTLLFSSPWFSQVFSLQCVFFSFCVWLELIWLLICCFIVRGHGCKSETFFYHSPNPFSEDGDGAFLSFLFPRATIINISQDLIFWRT